MFKFDISRKQILVILPKVMNFNKIFHEEICKFFFLAINNKLCLKLVVHAKHVVYCDNMCKAMLCNVMTYLAENKIKEVFIDSEFREKISSQVTTGNIANYSRKDIFDLVVSPNIEYYAMNKNDNPAVYVDDLVQKIVDTSICFSRDALKDILVSIIGEIIVNCRNHSKQDTAYIMHQISLDKENNCLYLNVNVIDYGETIVENIRQFFNRPRMQIKTCMAWARAEGHSTKQGSGGYGIPQMVDYIKAVKGNLSIYSGSGVFYLDNDGNEYFERLENGDFQGTSVSFGIKLFGMNALVIDERNKVKCIKSVSLKDLI